MKAEPCHVNKITIIMTNTNMSRRHRRHSVIADDAIIYYNISYINQSARPMHRCVRVGTDCG